MVKMLGIDVPADLLSSWRTWLAPDPQPFVIDRDDERWNDLESDQAAMTAELRDSFRLWAAPANSTILWLTHDRFLALPKQMRAALVRTQVDKRNGNRPGIGRVPTVRGWADLLDANGLRAQADGHRFVWWPHLVGQDPIAVLERLVSIDRLPSRHHDVSTTTWRHCHSVLPQARSLGGTWPTGSTANCFSTVMDAAGADGTSALASVEHFDTWLANNCRVGGDDRSPGTVLVWRDGGGSPVHAAVTIGDGWGLEKPSQEWHSPRAIAQIQDVIRSNRHPGERLERQTLTV